MARDNSPAAVATFRLLKPKRGPGWTIDVVDVATDAWPRERISAQITAWEGAGLVDVTGKQVRAVRIEYFPFRALCSEHRERPLEVPNYQTAAEDSC